MSEAPLTEPSPEEIARAKLVAWAQDQPAWVQLAAALVVDARGQDRDSPDRVFAALLAHSGLTGAEIPEVDLGAHATTPVVDRPTTVLTSIDDITCVNALSQDRIQFAPRLSVFYGENGTGKSGYARILSSALKGAPEVLPNVDGESDGEPKAIIQIREDGDAVPFEWTNERVPELQTKYYFFDGSQIDLHVRPDKGFDYIPRALSSFTQLYQLLGEVRTTCGVWAALITEEEDPRKAVELLDSRFADSVLAAGSVSALMDATHILRSDFDAETRKQELETLQATLQEGTSDEQLLLLKQREDLAARSLAALFSIVASSWEKAPAIRVELTKAQQKLAEAWKRLREEAQISAGEAEPEFIEFIQSGEPLINAVFDHEYPAPGDHCIYCQQSLSANAVDFITTAREVASGDLQEKHDAAHDRLNEAQAAKAVIALQELHPQIISTLQTIDEDNDSRSVWESLEALMDQARSLRPESPASGLWVALHPRFTEIAVTLSVELSEISAMRKQLEARVNQREAWLGAIEIALSELEAISAVRTIAPSIESYLEALEFAEKVEELQGTISSKRASLSHASRSAGKQSLGGEFQRLFEQERRNLRAPNVDVKFSGSEGTLSRLKSVFDDHDLREVFSEGELKAVALADFLAEVQIDESATPIVLDDPVSSLDAYRMRDVADRLFRASKRRQVIVFSHNSMFVASLLDPLYRPGESSDGCNYTLITKEEDRVGLTDEGGHPRIESLSKLKGKLNRYIQDAEGLTGEARHEKVEQCYSVLRAWCEVFVEQEVLGMVVQRYKPNISLWNLDRVKGTALQEVGKVLSPIYDRACRMTEAHSSPGIAVDGAYKLDDVKSDWEECQELRTLVKKQ